MKDRESYRWDVKRNELRSEDTHFMREIPVPACSISLGIVHRWSWRRRTTRVPDPWDNARSRPGTGANASHNTLLHPAHRDRQTQRNNWLLYRPAILEQFWIRVYIGERSHRVRAELMELINQNGLKSQLKKRGIALNEIPECWR